jgi:UDP-glucose 4-epimerase
MALYLVTGGGGFIGSHLVRALIARGDSVRILDNFSTGKPSNLAGVESAIQMVEGSITDAAAVGKAMQGVDYVLHHAAQASVQRSIDDPLETHTINATGTLTLLHAAHIAHVKRLIYAGSSSAYGDDPTDCKHEGIAPQPLSPYAASKLAGELYCQAFTQSYGLETVILRYFNVFGERQDPTSAYSAVIPRFVTQLLDDARPIIFGDGLQSRDFVYVQNVVQANLLACAAPAEQVAGQVFNIASGGRINLLDLARLLNEMLGTAQPPEFRAARAGDIRFSHASIEKARTVLGYAPAVSFEEGLRQTLEWFRDHDGS